MYTVCVSVLCVLATQTILYFDRFDVYSIELSYLLWRKHIHSGNIVCAFNSMVIHCLYQWWWRVSECAFFSLANIFQPLITILHLRVEGRLWQCYVYNRRIHRSMKEKRNISIKTSKHENQFHFPLRKTANPHTYALRPGIPLCLLSARVLFSCIKFLLFRP